MRGDANGPGSRHRLWSKRRTNSDACEFSTAVAHAFLARGTCAVYCSEMPAPVSIDGVGKTAITVTWEDDHVGVYPGRYLRSLCRCAECIEEMTGKKLLDESKIPEDIRYEKIGLVGGYAISILWSDGHATGIYTFANLRKWCPCAQCKAESGSR